MRLIKSAHGYDYYIGINEDGKPYYNIVPAGSPKPAGGYYAHEYICHIKKVSNYFYDL